MQKLIIAALLGATTIAGACTTTSIPEVSRIGNEMYTVTAEIKPGLPAVYNIKIDGELVVSQKARFADGNHQNFTGSWRGKRVDARAMYVSKVMTGYILIDVFIDGVHIDTLTVTA